MKTMATGITVIILSLLVPLNSAFAGMRCGTNLVSEGDSKLEVLEKCGEPLSKEIVGYIKYRRQWYGKTVKLEEWIYDIPGGYYYLLTFEGSRLVKVEQIRKE